MFVDMFHIQMQLMQRLDQWNDLCVCVSSPPLSLYHEDTVLKLCQNCCIVDWYGLVYMMQIVVRIPKPSCGCTLDVL